MKLKEVLMLVLFMVSVFLSAFFLPQLPGNLSVYLGLFSFEISKFLGISIFSFLCLLLLIIYWYSKSYGLFNIGFSVIQKSLESLVIFLMLLFIYFQILLVFWNTRLNFTYAHILAPIFSSLFFVFSLFLSWAREYNPFGLWTPWSVKSDEVWKKTHVVGTKFFKLLSLFSFLWVFFPGYFVYFVFLPFMVVIIGLLIFSYKEYSRKAVS